MWQRIVIILIHFLQVETIRCLIIPFSLVFSTETFVLYVPLIFQPKQKSGKSVQNVNVKEKITK